MSQLATEGVFHLKKESLGRLFVLLLSFLRSSTSREGFVESILRILQVVTSLVPLVPNSTMGVPILCQLLAPGKTCVDSIPIRRGIIEVLEAIQKKENSADAEKAITLIKELHAMSGHSIGAYDFTRRGDAYDKLLQQRLSSFGTPEWSFTALLSCILHDMCEDDMMIRSSALRCLTDFVHDAYDFRERDAGLEGIVKSSLVPGLCFVLRSSYSDTIRRCGMQVFRHILVLWHSAPSTDFFQDLFPLTSSDEESDALLGLYELQTRRRLRSLRQICDAANGIRSGTIPPFAARSIRTILLPTLFAIIRDSPKNAGIFG